MLFNSIQFLFFFILVTGVYFALPHNRRWLWLLLSSCYFYMAFVPVYILILGFTIVVDYFSGIFIEKSSGRKRKLFLIASLVANIGTLVVFKYYNFLNGIISGLLGLSESGRHLPYLTILLPIGLSFHTFQAMSYTIEVYRGNQKAEKHFGIYSLYVMFYPQLVAGPIERPQNLIHQFREKFNFDYNRVVSGLQLMAWGLFKKVVIADRLTILVDTVFDHPAKFNSLSLIIGAVFFSFQILCDFSGYSDMAIGAARVMGFRLMTNFDDPYRSKSVREFWTRWHISLSTWFKDYLYIPLGGNRVGIPRWCFNLMIVFLISGIWHGANWTFIVWGLLHGLFFVFSILTQRIRQRAGGRFALVRSPIVNITLTFVLVTLAWIFFRATNVQTALFFIRKIFTGIPDVYTAYRQGGIIIEDLGMSRSYLVLSFVLILFLQLVNYMLNKPYYTAMWKRSPAYIRWALYYAYIVSLLFWGVYENKEFIYFQF
jgi:alginate O-acetyltransferase complex protein AlgI